MTWYSWIIVWILGGIHKNVGRKIWYFGGIHEMQKKNWNHLVPRMGPRAYFRLRRAAAPAAGASRFYRGLRRCAAEAKNALGPILGTRWFQFILFLHFMKPQKFQIFWQQFCETTQYSNNNPWNRAFSWFYANNYFFFAASFSETMTVANSFK